MKMEADKDLVGDQVPLAVQATNDDSIVSKRSASRFGYFNDEFLRAFVRKPPRRSPLINRGYYIRCFAIRSVLRSADGSQAARAWASAVPLLLFFVSTTVNIYLAGACREFLKLVDPASGVRGPKQIVSLGAGFDTSYWVLRVRLSFQAEEIIFGF